MFWFTADEHYGHKNILKYTNRPFSSLEEMEDVLISRHQEVVKKGDIIIHAGDFMWTNKRYVAERFLEKLNGTNFVLKGSHDNWIPIMSPYIWEKQIQQDFIVVCHYAMRAWARSHYNSWQLHGHSHGGLNPIGKQYDIGVDNNNFYPISYEQLRIIMKDKPDNFNYIKK